MPLLHLICRSSLGVAEDEEDVNNKKYNNVHLIYPSHPAEPHVVSHGTFLLLELFGEAFGTREQRIDQVLADSPPMISYHIMLGALLLPISAKMSREEVISFKIRDVSLEDRSDVDVFSKLLGVFTEHCSGANLYFTIDSHPVSQARPSLPSLID